MIDNGRRYKVVVNEEEQYSIWFDEKPIPHGWSAEGEAGTKEECLRYIEKVWADILPLSLRSMKKTN
ncbi:MbtH family protein [Pseudomonas graminis]|uniref:MbtH family protein n=1 Tax=Pseudomonas graminis TaxID=158627 RepID=UPI00234A3FD0|nr:MbtH family protein [Pseudomonas graminis]MDC6379904.1 MbtH family protein [Pseudomonas graminis]